MHYHAHVIWFTGLSGAGKSTLATGLQNYFITQKIPVQVIDGDILRQGICHDLGFSPSDRTENIRRASTLAAQLSDNGYVVISALITPTEKDRELAKSIIGAQRFHQVYLKSDITTCSARDPKGLYQKALSGEIKEFTGISAPFEEPQTSSLIIDTRNMPPEESLYQLTQYLLPIIKQPQVSFS